MSVQIYITARGDAFGYRRPASENSMVCFFMDCYL